jgi:hypothetical protein
VDKLKEEYNNKIRELGYLNEKMIQYNYYAEENNLK